MRSTEIERGLFTFYEATLSQRNRWALGKVVVIDNRVERKLTEGSMDLSREGDPSVVDGKVVNLAQTIDRGLSVDVLITSNFLGYDSGIRFHEFGVDVEVCSRCARQQP